MCETLIFNKTNDIVVEQRRTPLKLRACLNDTDVPYFDRFFLVDKMILSLGENAAASPTH
ncbi:hypothetical protein G5I_14661 [Acromyrmex echinatior]|uniref:Uncharacterized protein n=1 Tax=Acromyrmex echinatior TaxID=103372 RepID=F4X890_ACREC|nr:hypothetical protein G5I_14661 [Acromyrmex echinatior]